MQDWQLTIWRFVQDQLANSWRWFDSLSREEWVIVLAATCALGFLFLKKWGPRAT